jgi:hypothetical protein
MPPDLPLLLWCVIPAAVVGLAIGAVFRYFRPPFIKRLAARSATFHWWYFATFAAFFVLLTTLQIFRGWWSFAVLFGCFALLEIVAMGLALGRKAVHRVGGPDAYPDFDEDLPSK